MGRWEVVVEGSFRKFHAVDILCPGAPPERGSLARLSLLEGPGFLEKNQNASGKKM